MTCLRRTRSLMTSSRKVRSCCPKSRNWKLQRKSTGEHIERGVIHTHTQLCNVHITRRRSRGGSDFADSSMPIWASMIPRSRQLLWIPLGLTVALSDNIPPSHMLKGMTTVEIAVGLEKRTEKGAVAKGTVKFWVQSLRTGFMVMLHSRSRSRLD